MNKLKTITIKGREYVQVSERVKAFNELYKNGSIRTEVIDRTADSITMRAIIIPDFRYPERFFTGTAHEVKGDTASMVNKTSHIENCETSAVGRALAMMGIGIVDGIASADEVAGAMAQEPKVGDVVQVSDTKKIEIPACSICGGAMEQRKWGNATFWGCKDNWKKHKEAKEKPKPIFQKDLEQELPVIEHDQPF